MLVNGFLLRLSIDLVVSMDCASILDTVNTGPTHSHTYARRIEVRCKYRRHESQCVSVLQLTL